MLTTRRSAPALAALAFVLACHGPAAAEAGRERVLRFDLREAGAGPVTQETLRGRFALVYFGYSRCPDICPTDLARLGAALEQLDAIAGRLEAVFIDVDPRPLGEDRLAGYVRWFHPRLRALDGPPDAVSAAAASLGARITVREADGETLIDHSSSFFLVGRDGRLLAELPRWMPPRDLVAAIAWFTIEPAEAAPDGARPSAAPDVRGGPP